MTGRDPDLHPKHTYAVTWPGGRILIVALSSHDAINITFHPRRWLFDRCNFHAERLTPEQVFECEQQGMETIRAVP